MRQFRTVNLIAFCVLVLIIENNDMTEGYNLKYYFRIFPGLKQLKNLRHGILPGTLWCGLGNIASNDSDLGVYKELDACCRAHDRCEDYINPKSTRYGLNNKYICRSSLCECELRFYDCLAQIHGFYASVVGNLYFKNCKRCFRTYYDPLTCIEEGLDINEETDRKGRRVFCARFDQNPKWGQRRNTATPPESISVPELSTWYDDEPVTQSVSQSYSANDRKYSSDEDDEDFDRIYENYAFMNDNY